MIIYRIISADPSQQGERVRGAVPLSLGRDHQSQCPRPVAASTAAASTDFCSFVRKGCLVASDEGPGPLRSAAF